MKKVFSAGGIVFKKEGENLYFLLINNESIKDPSVHYWGFSKGHVEKGEDMKSTALREVLEETGIKAEIVAKVGESKYFFSDVREGGEAVKTVTLYLMKYLEGEPKNQEAEVSKVEWFSFDEAMEKISFERDKELLQQALEIMNGLK